MDSVDLLDAGPLVGDEDEEDVQDSVDHEGHDTSSMDSKSGDVATWLISLNLGDLVPRFYSQGYDDLDVIRALDEKDLDALGIDKPGIRKKLLLYAGRIGSKIPTTKPLPPPSLPPPEPKIPQHPQQQQQLTPPQSSKKSRSPYRCSKCCMFKVQSINKHNSHKCDEKLIGHNWETCPTHNLRAHPEEQENRRKRRAEERKKKKEENKKQKVERKRKQEQQREHPLVAVDWDTFRQEELRRIIQANPERYSKDMEGQRLMEAMLIIIARYNELKGMVEQMKNKKRKYAAPPEEPMPTPMTMQEVLDTNNRLAINSLQSVSPALLQQQMQLEQQLQQQETLEQHKLQLQHLQLQQLQQQQRQKQHEALQAQALQTQQLQHQQHRLVQQHQAQSQQTMLQQHLVQQQMMHHHQQAQQAQLQQQPQQHPLLQSVVLQPGLVRHPTDE